MRLTGALSDPDVGSSLARLDELRAKLIVAITDAPARPGTVLKLRAGLIQTAIMAALDAAAGPLTVGEIQTHVEAQLGQAISRHTVTSFLSVACRGDVFPVVRLAPGRYAGYL